MLSNFARLKILRRKTNLCLIHRTISTGGFQWDIPEKFNFAQDVIDAYAKGGLISEDILTLVFKKCAKLLYIFSYFVCLFVCSRVESLLCLTNRICNCRVPWVSNETRGLTQLFISRLNFF